MYISNHVTQGTFSFLKCNFLCVWKYNKAELRLETNCIICCIPGNILTCVGLFAIWHELKYVSTGCSLLKCIYLNGERGGLGLWSSFFLVMNVSEGQKVQSWTVTSSNLSLVFILRIESKDVYIFVCFKWPNFFVCPFVLFLFNMHPILCWKYNALLSVLKVL